MKDHAVFTQLNDAILLNFDAFSFWERAFLSDIQDKMMHEYQLSSKQRLLTLKILGKKTNARS